jgi:hypothetical protein
MFLSFCSVYMVIQLTARCVLGYFYKTKYIDQLCTFINWAGIHNIKYVVENLKPW